MAYISFIGFEQKQKQVLVLQDLFFLCLRLFLYLCVYYYHYYYYFCFLLGAKISQEIVPHITSVKTITCFGNVGFLIKENSLNTTCHVSLLRITKNLHIDPW